MLRTVQAAGELITLAEAKAHLNVDFAEDDDLITSLIGAATIAAQTFVQRRFVEQTVEWVQHHWHCGDIRLPIAPVAKDGVVFVKYTDFVGAEQTLPASQYVVQTCGHSVRIIPALGAIWPLLLSASSEPVVIRFKVGEAVDKVGSNIKAAVNLTLGHLYRNRETVVLDGNPIELPQSAQMLLLGEVW